MTLFLSQEGLLIMANDNIMIAPTHLDSTFSNSHVVPYLPLPIEPHPIGTFPLINRCLPLMNRPTDTILHLSRTIPFLAVDHTWRISTDPHVTGVLQGVVHPLLIVDPHYGIISQGPSPRPDPPSFPIAGPPAYALSAMPPASSLAPMAPVPTLASRQRDFSCRL
ncbi:uncharacterized protein EDB91DRAFT_1256596 [Suillus paluster]|uniref:uncharacterized protein n=1 Tax=Suillus paluster TaxID=48578 RepID=UPI001B875FA9|nr:uncharacterized protein EDB91DRAFT_1256596 [Suillus paluster]KAG1721241.1 hypothetical protein EDB91DRAFT_1256596 [Suillus paluster]